jgi:hypothetical protein
LLHFNHFGGIFNIVIEMLNLKYNLHFLHKNYTLM